MSLRTFHLIFVACATLLMAAFCAWSVREFVQVGGFANLAMSIAGGLAALVLLVYGRWFLQKIAEAGWA